MVEMCNWKLPKSLMIVHNIPLLDERDQIDYLIV